MYIMKNPMRVISMILILSYLCNINFVAGSEKYSSLILVSNLAPESREAPVTGDDILSRHKVETFLKYNIPVFSEYYESMSREAENIFAEIGGDKIELLFRASKDIPVVSDEVTQDSLKLRVTPCRVNGKDFRISQVMRKDGMMTFAVHTEKEFLGFGKDLLDKEKIEEQHLDRLNRKVSFTDTEIYTVAWGDKSVDIARRFFRMIDAEFLENRLNRYIDGKKLLITKGPALVAGGVVLDSGLEAKYRAWDIVQEVLAPVGYGMTDADTVRFKKAFDSMQSEIKNVGEIAAARNMIREIKASIEKGVSNEEGIEIENLAYDARLYLSNIKEDSDIYQNALIDILTIFGKVMKHEVETYNKEVFPGMEILKADIPGSSLIFDEEISDHLVPVAVSYDNGAVKINPNFVRAMALLKRLGFDDGKADVYDHGKKADPGYLFGMFEEQDKDKEVMPPKYLGNLYWSILYSVVIHQIRGSFSIENGVAVLDLDPEKGHARRGKKYLEPNLIAMLYFWYGIVENSYTFKASEITRFIKKYPEMFRGLNEDQKKRLPQNAWELFFKMDNLTGLTGYPTIKTIRPLDLFRLLCREGRSITFEGIKDTVKDVDDYIIRRGLDVLEYIGAVYSKERIEKGKKRIFYEKAPLYNDALIAAEEVLSRVGSGPWRVEMYSEQKMEFIEKTEPFWAKNFIQEVDELTVGREVIIAVEAGWIPPVQRDSIRALVQEMNKLDNVRVLWGETPENLAEKIYDVQPGVSWKNFIILGSEATVKKFYDQKKFQDPWNNGGKAFLAGVKSDNITDNTYIRITEMLSRAVRMSFSGGLFPDRKDMGSFVDENGILIFFPDAEKIDIGTILDLYSLQQSVLESA